METIRFKGDSATRRRFFTPESFQHPAKMASGLVLECVERYSKPDDWLLDPMAGSGTLLLGAMYGRNLILNELESHFVLPMQASWAKIQRNGPALGCSMGKVCILRGDARCLPMLSADTIITSPPYEGSEIGGLTSGIIGNNANPASSILAGQRLGVEDVGTGYTRPPGADVILTSPPYEGVADSSKNTNTNDAARGYPTAPMAYTRLPVADVVITSPPYENSDMKSPVDTDGNHQVVRKAATKVLGYTRPVDAIVTSPPYEDRVANDSQRTFAVTGILKGMNEGDGQTYGNGTNIGNLRSAAYWSAMAKVYQECYRVLRPGGIMALVLKGFTRDGKYVDLPWQTEAMLLEAGWVKHDEWRRQLWSLSFWRILQKRRSPETWDERLGYESVLAFRKPEDCHAPLQES